MAKKTPPKDPDPRWSSELPPAPGELRVVQALANLVGPDPGSDALTSGGLLHWMELWGLAPPGTELSADDLERALAAREALRTMLAGNAGGSVDVAAIARLDQLAQPAMNRIRFDEAGRVRLEAVPGGLDGALARLCGIVAVAQFDGTWRHMKLCAGPKCRTAFYDFSRNHSARWCSSRCASRLSSKLYRQRNLERLRKAERENAFFRREAQRLRRFL